MAQGSATDAPVPSEVVPTAEKRKQIYFPAHLKIAARLRKGDKTSPRPVRLAKLGVISVGGSKTGSVATPIPPLGDSDTTELETAAIRDPYSFVRITYHNVRNEYVYEVIEPPLTGVEVDLVQRLKVALIDKFQPLTEVDPVTKRREMRRMVDQQFHTWELSPSPVTKGRVLYYLER